MTTDASRVGSESELSSSGQSMIEFLLFFPLLLGMTLIVYRANTAIQTGIVNQQYARMQAHFLAFNSPHYPDLGFQVRNIAAQNMGVFHMGISQSTFAPDDEMFDKVPTAPIVDIARSSTAPGGDDEAQTEPTRRTKVRVRSSVSFCTQVLHNRGRPILALEPNVNRTYHTTKPVAGAKYNLDESTQFEFCKDGGFLVP